MHHSGIWEPTSLCGPGCTHPCVSPETAEERTELSKMHEENQGLRLFAGKCAGKGDPVMFLEGRGKFLREEMQTGTL